MLPHHHNTKARSILQELVGHNSYFDDLVNMFPANLYNSGNNEQEISNLKYHKGQGKDTKSAKKARIKLANAESSDNNHVESSSQRLAQKEVDVLNASNDGDQFDYIDGKEDEESTSATSAQNSKQENAKAGDEKNGVTRVQNLNSNHSRIEQLRSKLLSKLQERSQKTVNGKSDNIVSKRAARRVEKRKRQEIAKKKALSKSTSTSQLKFSGTKGSPGKINKLQDVGGIKINSDSGEMKTVSDDLSGIDFGGIAGLKSDALTQQNYSNINKSLKNLGKKKSLERLLAEAEAKKLRLRELKESCDNEDKVKAKNIEWGDTLKAASGTKTRETDPAHLKKALKRKVKKKAKSAVAWKSRLEQTKDKMDQRQQIRNHNIKQRTIGGAAGSNLSKKRIKESTDSDINNSKGDKAKRPRLGPHSLKNRAGFEGRKQEFINKGKDPKEKRLISQ